MKESMTTIGKQLAARRTELNLSLKEAQNATSIQLIHLQALEDGEHEKLISPIYAQGFLKQYARFLGLDGEKIVRDHPEVFQARFKQEFDYGIGTVEKRGSPGSSVKWFPNLLWAIGIGATLAVAYFAARALELV